MKGRQSSIEASRHLKKQREIGWQTYNYANI